MPSSKNPRRYSDCQKILDVAIAKGQCVTEFKTYGQAVNMAQRINTFQTLMENLDPETPYTDWLVQRPAKGETVLRVLPRNLETSGGTILTEHDDVEIRPIQPSRPENPLATAEAMLRAEGLLEPKE